MSLGVGRPLTIDGYLTIDRNSLGMCFLRDTSVHTSERVTSAVCLLKDGVIDQE